MSDSLVFSMGQFEAEFPRDRMYVKNHMWAVPIGNQSYRFGFSAYAVRLLQDIYFIEFTVEPPAEISHRQDIGSIESKKAESGIYSPMAGRLDKLNELLLGDPSVINVDKYGDGWLFEIHGDQAELLSPEDYMIHLASAWEVAQRTIKGQANA